MKSGIHIGAVPGMPLREHAIRFMFGGCITVVAGLITHLWGPAIGGLFLAFPAILPATLTLVAHHGGRRQAIAETRGAIFGAVALVAFACVAWRLAGAVTPAMVLISAAMAWALIAILLARIPTSYCR